MGLDPFPFWIRVKSGPYRYNDRNSVKETWYESGSKIQIIDERLKATDRKVDGKDSIERQEKKDGLIRERATRMEDKGKNFIDKRSAIEIIQERDDIERQKNIIRERSEKNDRKNG